MIPVNGAYVVPEIVVWLPNGRVAPAELDTGPKIAVPVGAAAGRVGAGQASARTGLDGSLGDETAPADVPLATTDTV
jgi:hypothetical protein